MGELNKPSMTFADMFACTHEAPECLLNFLPIFGFWRDPTTEERKESPNTISILEDGLLMPHMWWGFTSLYLDGSGKKEPSEYMSCQCGAKRKRKIGDANYSKH